MAAVSRFFHALPKGRGGGAGQSKNDRLPGKGTGKAEESLVVQRQHP